MNENSTCLIVKPRLVKQSNIPSNIVLDGVIPESIHTPCTPPHERSLEFLFRSLNEFPGGRGVRGCKTKNLLLGGSMAIFQNYT